MQLSRMTRGMMKKLLIDTDGCADDIRALVLALQNDRCNVLALTTVFGGVNIDQAVANCARTLRAVGKSQIAIYKGADRPLLRSVDRVKSDAFFGKDGVGDRPDVHPKALESDFNAAVHDEMAALALCRLAGIHKHALTLVCIGPLTNVALALKMDDHFALNIGRVVVMGGNLYGCGNVSHKSTAEFNFNCDPEAAQIVLEEMKCPITCVPWEAFFLEGKSHESRVDFDAHLHVDTQLAVYLAAVTNVGRRYLSTVNRQYAYCDEIAVAVALDPEGVVKQSKSMNAVVELAGRHTRGQLAIDWYRQLRSDDGVDDESRIRFVTAYDVDKVGELMHQAVRKPISDMQIGNIDQ